MLDLFLCLKNNMYIELTPNMTTQELYEALANNVTQAKLDIKNGNFKSYTLEELLNELKK